MQLGPVCGNAPLQRRRQHGKAPSNAAPKMFSCPVYPQAYLCGNMPPETSTASTVSEMHPTLRLHTHVVPIQAQPNGSQPIPGRCRRFKDRAGVHMRVVFGAGGRRRHCSRDYTLGYRQSC